jgi:hypothetical protein
MEISLVHKNQLILGPMGFNIRMINSELEDLELNEKITSQSYGELPIHFSDNLTHLLPIEKNIPLYDSKYHNIGNFAWEIIEENNIPVKVKYNYIIENKTLGEVKELRKGEIVPIRKEKENISIKVNINNKEILVSTSREERLLLVSKLFVCSDTCNYKFLNTWEEITKENLQYIIEEIDKIVQKSYDWEVQKLSEIDSCETIDQVYEIEIK